VIIKVNALTAGQFASLGKFLASTANRPPKPEIAEFADLKNRFLESENTAEGTRILDHFCTLVSARSSKEILGGMDVVLRVATCLKGTPGINGVIIKKKRTDILKKPRRRVHAALMLKLCNSVGLFET